MVLISKFQLLALIFLLYFPFAFSAYDEPRKGSLCATFFHTPCLGCTDEGETPALMQYHIDSYEANIASMSKGGILTIPSSGIARRTHYTLQELFGKIKVVKLRDQWLYDVRRDNLTNISSVNKDSGFNHHTYTEQVHRLILQNQLARLNRFYSNTQTKSLRYDAKYAPESTYYREIGGALISFKFIFSYFWSYVIHPKVSYLAGDSAESMEMHAGYHAALEDLVKLHQYVKEVIAYLVKKTRGDAPTISESRAIFAVVKSLVMANVARGRAEEILKIFSESGFEDPPNQLQSRLETFLVQYISRLSVKAPTIESLTSQQMHDLPPYVFTTPKGMKVDWFAPLIYKDHPRYNEFRGSLTAPAILERARDDSKKLFSWELFYGESDAASLTAFASAKFHGIDQTAAFFTSKLQDKLGQRLTQLIFFPSSSEGKSVAFDDRVELLEKILKVSLAEKANVHRLTLTEPLLIPTHHMSQTEVLAQQHYRSILKVPQSLIQSYQPGDKIIILDDSIRTGSAFDTAVEVLVATINVPKSDVEGMVISKVLNQDELESHMLNLKPSENTDN